MTDGATNTRPERGISPPDFLQVLSRWSPMWALTNLSKGTEKCKLKSQSLILNLPNKFALLSVMAAIFGFVCPDVAGILAIKNSRDIVAKQLDKRV